MIFAGSLVMHETIPSNDGQRIAALESCDILDTPAELSFDLITSMVAQMLSVPHSCVSLVDRERVWFKSAFGVEVSEVDREPGFCSTLVVSDEEVRHIEDASVHPETKKNSLVCGQPNVRFYAGAPLCTADGYRIGTLCAFGPEPRSLSETERLSLRNLAILVMHEIDLRKTRAQLERTETTLRQAQRLESVGLVASGVAHDFNNLLVGILGNAELLNRRLVSQPDCQRLTEEIKSAGRRAADLVGQVLAYAGREDTAPKVPVDLNALVRETHQMLKASLPPDVAVHRQLEEELPAVRGQATGLRQVVMNLLTNASEACRESRGDVTLSTFSNPDKDTVTLIVADRGHGMNDEVKARIFEPFFTSKSGGRGLGLSICRRIVEEHGGRIEVESTIGQGTKFRVDLPSCNQRVSEQEAEPRKLPKRAAEGLVLVVDDESTVREFSHEILKQEGYRVRVASGGCEALEILDANHSEISVMVLDWSMPDLGAEEVLAEMSERRFKVPVVLASGHLEEDARARLPENSIRSFLKKPFDLEDLLLAVGQALDGRRLSQPA